MSTTVSYKGQNIATVSNNTKTLETEGKYLEADIILTDQSQSTPVIDPLTVTPTTSQQTFNSSSVDGYKPVVVEAMPSGTAGTPSASKGTVNNHSVSVTPSVTNTTGYITGSTKTGAAVTVTASELVSGSETKTQNGTYDVTNLAELVVNVSGGGIDIPVFTATYDENDELLSFVCNKSFAEVDAYFNQGANGSAVIITTYPYDERYEYPISLDYDDWGSETPNIQCTCTEGSGFPTVRFIYQRNGILTTPETADVWEDATFTRNGIFYSSPGKAYGFSATVAVPTVTVTQSGSNLSIV